jgi:hypothetical protein
MDNFPPGTGLGPASSNKSLSNALRYAGAGTIPNRFLEASEM